jgi:diadenylate cyclase
MALLNTMAFAIGFLEIHLVDVIDIFLVGIALYQFYKLVRNTVAMRVFVGFMVIYFVYLVIKATEMELMTAILGQFMGVGMIAVVVLFQQEIKRFLVIVGQSTKAQRDVLGMLLGKKETQSEIQYEGILKALKHLSGTNCGALIVIAKKEELKQYIETGDYLDAEVSERLITSIFFKNSPLHDGGAIIVGGRIKAARCILPISSNDDIPAFMGLRHRAAIGISEIADVIVLTVSEETGQMSVVEKGVISHNLSLAQMRERLKDFLNQE